MSAAFEVAVDLTNPGQFFACCGLFEVAERLSGRAEAWFSDGRCFIDPGAALTLKDCVEAAGSAKIERLVPTDNTASPILMTFKRGSLRLDWWKDAGGGGVALKPWAGTMQGHRIALAMQHAMREAPAEAALLDHGQVVFDPAQLDNKVEPFYFDARRGANATALDVGFSLDSLQIQSLAYPGAEFLCLVGLQRFRPRPTSARRVFEYFTWAKALRPLPASLAACGVTHADRGFTFENAFRTAQKKHKAFSPATPLGRNTR